MDYLVETLLKYLFQKGILIKETIRLRNHVGRNVEKDPLISPLSAGRCKNPFNSSNDIDFLNTFKNQL